MSLHIVILAAGQGSRMKSDLPKVLHKVAGKPMLQHVVDTVKHLDADGIHIIVGHGAEKVKQTISGNINWCYQTEQLGTGHAVAQALPSIPVNSQVLILYGDVPLISKSTLITMLQGVTEENIALLTVQLDNPMGYGRIIRNFEGNIKAIVEEKDATDEIKDIREVNTGILALTSNHLHKFIPMLGNKNTQGEYYLTDLIELANKGGNKIYAFHPEFEQEVQGVNNRLQLCELECWHQSRISEQLMLNGVTLYDPNRIDVRGTLLCGKDVEIDINCIFIGHVEIGDGVIIGPNCVIENSSIGAKSIVFANSIVESSVVAEEVSIGPFARIRPGTRLENKSKVGNFVETKKTIVGEGSKINHLSYVGDAILGKKVNVGAGTITCNYDGVNKFLTEIGDGVFVGSNTSLVAPVKIGKESTIAAGSTITKKIGNEQLAIARSRQKNIDGWQRPTKK
ncbi:MAG: bifunctional UDP-N-acetylglucosamine pyrophosphorylase/glucosamine-1-phosphate N-acetyltransferase [Oleiphilaceae bacterium]|jgi:bifunctional UDP-N-acetylglucosamine pyrophosphorylase/glucosamine-1-phosphate N-acetyltransferase